MSCTQFAPSPRETVQAVEAVFGKDNLYLAISDHINDVCAGLDWAGLYDADKPMASVARLALVTLFQFCEGIPDRQAVEAVRTRVDWTPALHLPLDHLGFDSSALCDFRQRLRQHPTAQTMLHCMLTRLLDLELLPSHVGRQAAVEQVLDKVCRLSRLELTAQAMQLALETVAALDPKWLCVIARPYWYERYSPQSSAVHSPREPEKCQALAHTIAADARHLLQQIAGAGAPRMALLPEVFALREILAQQFEQSEDQLKWRSAGCAHCGY